MEPSRRVQVFRDVVYVTEIFAVNSTKKDPYVQVEVSSDATHFTCAKVNSDGTRETVSRLTASPGSFKLIPSSQVTSLQPIGGRNSGRFLVRLNDDLISDTPQEASIFAENILQVRSKRQTVQISTEVATGPQFYVLNYRLPSLAWDYHLHMQLKAGTTDTPSNITRATSLTWSVRTLESLHQLDLTPGTHLTFVDDRLVENTSRMSYTYSKRRDVAEVASYDDDPENPSFVPGDAHRSASNEIKKTVETLQWKSSGLTVDVTPNLINSTEMFTTTHTASIDVTDMTIIQNSKDRSFDTSVGGAPRRIVYAPKSAVLTKDTIISVYDVDGMPLKLDGDIPTVKSKYHLFYMDDVMRLAYASVPVATDIQKMVTTFHTTVQRVDQQPFERDIQFYILQPNAIKVELPSGTAYHPSMNPVLSTNQFVMVPMLAKKGTTEGELIYNVWQNLG